MSMQHNNAMSYTFHDGPWGQKFKRSASAAPSSRSGRSHPGFRVVQYRNIRGSQWANDAVVHEQEGEEQAERKMTGGHIGKGGHLTPNGFKENKGNLK
ncbi:hypothetical protein AJ80_04559 [Polytolypa hystricis UAMH7299]|uniref:Uncharacterized protein n=1 Tax=Polytolypa hystricis (strain UAMH7299) TaxID=1447883 RepID=A0A2B7YBC0_POLH7|nr:hypothetical protein AJ80_04559 [Polytolypa hystricis UAMH7299]